MTKHSLKRSGLPVLFVALSILGAALVTSIRPASASPAGTYFDHVVIIAMENQPYSVFGIGQTPFENSLIAAGATLSHDDHYPTKENCSAGCYVAFTTGNETLAASQGDGWSCCIATTSIIDQLKTAGLTYELFCTEGCPRGLDHFPFAGYSDLQGDSNILVGTGACSSECKSTAISAANGASPPDYIWFTPTDSENMHSGSVSAADSYLQSFLVGSGTVASPATGSLLASNLFTKDHTLLWIWWDECGVSNGDGLNCDANSDSPNIFYGKMVKPGYTSNLQYNEYSELATIENNWALPLIANATSPPANANGAGPASISDIFGGSGPASPGSFGNIFSILWLIGIGIAVGGGAGATLYLRKRHSANKRLHDQISGSTTISHNRSVSTAQSNSGRRVHARRSRSTANADSG